ncbi:MAG: 50S ribosomal protein L3 [Nitrosopumilus sp.]|nr:50S ribosomal protein L3 [Nitrosopumilus sp.]
MGHRKYSAPRRGSIAFRPRSRAKSLEARIRTWPENYDKDNTGLIGFAGFKVGQIQVMTIDDKEKTPNYGKPLMNHSTVISLPPLKIVGVRGYSEDAYGKHAIFDVYSKDSIKDLSTKYKTKYSEDGLKKAADKLENTKHLNAIVAVFPHRVGISQKKPFIFEVPVSGKDIGSKFDYLKSKLGQELRASDVFKTGQNIDVHGISRGKGVEGPVTRFGVKRKQHKSRKSVRAVGTLGPISPAVVMYTVARQGQRGFHQRTEYNKRILLMSNSEKNDITNINPKGGFKHFGLVEGDYMVVRGTIPGVPKRLIKLRQPIRSKPTKNAEPKILEVMV